jgi:hypothetical protein
MRCLAHDARGGEAGQGGAFMETDAPAYFSTGKSSLLATDHMAVG